MEIKFQMFYGIQLLKKMFQMYQAKKKKKNPNPNSDAVLMIYLTFYLRYFQLPTCWCLGSFNLILFSLLQKVWRKELSTFTDNKVQETL